MTEVELSEEDYNILENWFERLFAKKNNSSKKERFLYSKLLVMHDSHIREKNEMKDMLSEK